MTTRAGNVIGGGDFLKDRIVPDVIKALKSNKKIFLLETLMQQDPGSMFSNLCLDI